MENQENKEQLGAEQPEKAPTTEADFKELAAKLRREEGGVDAEKEKGLAAARRLGERDKRKEQEKAAPKPVQANVGKAPEHPQKKGSWWKRALVGVGILGAGGGLYYAGQQSVEGAGPETSPAPIKSPATPEDKVSDERVSEKPTIVVEDESEESIKDKVNSYVWETKPAKTAEAAPAEPKGEIVQEMRSATAEAGPRMVEPPTMEEFSIAEQTGWTIARIRMERAEGRSDFPNNPATPSEARLVDAGDTLPSIRRKSALYDSSRLGKAIFRAHQAGSAVEYDDSASREKALQEHIAKTSENRISYLEKKITESEQKLEKEDYQSELEKSIIERRLEEDKSNLERLKTEG